MHYATLSFFGIYLNKSTLSEKKKCLISALFMLRACKINQSFQNISKESTSGVLRLFSVLPSIFTPCVENHHAKAQS